MANIYRKASIDRLSSPEQLDKLIQIASPSLWISVAGAALVVLFVLVWAICGKLPENVDINGLYMNDAGTQSVYASKGGVITSVLVDKDQEVKKGDVILVVADEDTKTAIEQIKERIRAVEKVTLLSLDDTATSDNGKLLEYKIEYRQADMTYEQKSEALEVMQKQLENAKNQTAEFKNQMDAAQRRYLDAIGDDGGNKAIYWYQQTKAEAEAAQAEYQNAVAAQAELSTQMKQNQTSYEEGKKQYAALESQAAELAGQQVQLTQAKQQYELLMSQYQGLDIPEEAQQMGSALEQAIHQLAGVPESLEKVQAAMQDIKTQLSQFEQLQSQLTNAQLAVKKAASALQTANTAYAEAEKNYQTYYTSQSSHTAEQTQLNTAFSQASTLYSNACTTQLSIENQIAQMKLETKQEGDVSLVSKDSLAEQFEATKEAALNELNQQLLQYNSGNASVEIKATESGIVTSAFVQTGEVIAQGTEILRIKASDSEDINIVLCYVPVADGKKLKPGMETVITPSTVSEQEYGHMIAKVLSAGTYGVSTQEMKQRLGDDLMVQAFQQKGPCVEVVVSLHQDVKTASGYQWSNKKGKTVELSENTIVTGKVRIQESAPITKLIPFLKEKLQVKEPQEDAR